MAARIHAARRGLALLATAFVVTACGGGDEDDVAVNPPVDPQPPTGGGAPPPPPIGGDDIVEVTVSGSVGDGPLVGANIRVFTAAGTQISESKSESTSTADYDIAIRTQGKNYPLVVTANGGTDLVTGAPADFRLKAALVRPSPKVLLNLNPFSTFMVDIASELGAVSDTHVDHARRIVVDRFGFGLDAELIPDPMASVINDGNVANMVKSSETIAEMLRRTRDALQAAGRSENINALIDIMASDLTDGLLDGRGGWRADSRVAAVANLATAEVLVEAMTNRLKVYGVNATAAMDGAIRVVRPTSAASTTDVPVPASALEQVRVALLAAASLNGDPVLRSAADVFAAASPGALPSALIPRLESGATVTAAAVATRAAAYGSAADHEAVNQVVRTRSAAEPLPPPNQAPVINGTPTTALVVGTAWSFAPDAYDPDGDPLSFSASNLPGWASFDSASGRLSGTPASEGTWSGIVVSVSDGTAQTALPGFTLSATREAVAQDLRIRIVAPTEREDGSPLTGLAGFRLHWGQSPGSYANRLEVSDPTATTAVLRQLAPGTWYIVASAYDSAGVESRPSEVLEATIR